MIDVAIPGAWQRERFTLRQRARVFWNAVKPSTAHKRYSDLRRSGSELRSFSDLLQQRKRIDQEYKYREALGRKYDGTPEQGDDKVILGWQSRNWVSRLLARKDPSTPGRFAMAVSFIAKIPGVDWVASKISPRWNRSKVEANNYQLMSLVQRDEALEGTVSQHISEVNQLVKSTEAEMLSFAKLKAKNQLPPTADEAQALATLLHYKSSLELEQKRRDSAIPVLKGFGPYLSNFADVNHAARVYKTFGPQTQQERDEMNPAVRRDVAPVYWRSFENHVFFSHRRFLELLHAQHGNLNFLVLAKGQAWVNDNTARLGSEAAASKIAKSVIRTQARRFKEKFDKKVQDRKNKSVATKAKEDTPVEQEPLTYELAKT